MVRGLPLEAPPLPEDLWVVWAGLPLAELNWAGLGLRGMYLSPSSGEWWNFEL